MLLSRALRTGPGSVVAFVGGGGKTSAMFRLAAELATRGPVITTTTTRIFAAQISLAAVHYHVASPDDLPDLTQLLSIQPHILLTGEADSNRPDKAPGISLETFTALLARTATLAPAVLVEADGSRMRPFKAPAAHEPVIPPETTHVVPVVGADVVGQPLTDEFVHRAGLVADLTGAVPGAPITPETVAAVLVHPEGGLKGVPPDARVSLLFNKVESPRRRRAGLEVADRLFSMTNDLEAWPQPGRQDAAMTSTPSGGFASPRQPPAYNAVLLASLRSDDPVQAVHGRTAGIVLAAGGSRRFGERSKQLLVYQGEPLVAHAVEAALDARLDEVIVVVGDDAVRVAEALGSRPVRRETGVAPVLVKNPCWAQGQSTSVKAGLRALSPGMDAAVFLLADQPLLAPDLIPALVNAHRRTLAPIVAPRHEGRRGNPVLFDRLTWPDLLALTGDTGGRALFEKYAGEVAWVEADEGVLLDIDTEEDYRRLQRIRNPGRGRK